jgi:hypothetical protein
VRIAIVLLWAFRVWAQFDGDPVEDGWVTTATREACEAGRRAFVDAARIYRSAVDLGPCQRMSPDEVRRLAPHPAPTLYQPTH